MIYSLRDLLNRCNKDECVSIRNAKGFHSETLLKFYEVELKKKFSNASESRWEIALLIADLVRSGAWAAFSKETHRLYEEWRKENGSGAENPYYPIGHCWWTTNTIYLITFLKENFGIGRTTLYNYLEVVDVFATYVVDDGKEPYYSINEEAKYYQFFQLVEMTSLTYQERKAVQPNWTREMIRAYKKELREKDRPKKEIQPAEEVEAEEPPMTEAQQRFAKYSKNDLIDEVVRLEEELAILKKQAESSAALQSGLTNTVDITEVKRAISGAVEALLKQYDYEITLCGRKQGVKAFAGNVAKGFINDFFVSDSGKTILASKPDKAFKVFSS